MDTELSFEEEANEDGIGILMPEFSEDECNVKSPRFSSLMRWLSLQGESTMEEESMATTASSIIIMVVFVMKEMKRDQMDSTNKHRE